MVVVMIVAGRRQHRRRRVRKEGSPRKRRGGWHYLNATWHIPLLRSVVLGMLWAASGRAGPVWLGLVPWGLWVWQGTGVLWPRLRGQPEWQGGRWLLWQGQRWLMVGCLGLLAGSVLRHAAATAHHPAVLGLGCVVCDREEPGVEVVQEEDGSYTATLRGHFTAHVGADHPFRVRRLLLFLRLLEVEGAQRRGRRTRDGRTPFVPQQQLSAWFKMPQPDISRIEMTAYRWVSAWGYELLPVASLCAGLSILWPTPVAEEHVPKS